MKRKLLAKIFYWLFLKKTTHEFYIVYPDDMRKPTEIGFDFYKVYNYLNKCPNKNT